jgi:hypothetical protein
MQRITTALIAVAALGASACEKKKSTSGLAPATDWQAANPGGSGGTDPGAPPPMTNPHGAAGMDPNNPHGAMPPGGDPHGGMGGTDVTKMGLPAPDPNRPINPNNVLSGSIEAGAMADKLKAGTAVFLKVQVAGPDGAALGPPVAVEKLNWAGASIPFTLSEANAMIAGTQLTGNVVITARYDQDGDAISKQTGDVIGVVKATVPSKTLKITFDSVLP